MSITRKNFQPRLHCHVSLQHVEGQLCCPVNAEEQQHHPQLKIIWSERWQLSWNCRHVVCPSCWILSPVCMVDRAQDTLIRSECWLLSHIAALEEADAIKMKIWKYSYCDLRGREVCGLNSKSYILKSCTNWYPGFTRFIYWPLYF